MQKWGDYDAFGDAVSPTKFIPMKTPLGSEILENWNLEDPPRHPLTVAILQKQQSCLGRQVGMIIDLSNHDSLYGPDLIECGIQYERVPVKQPSTMKQEMNAMSSCQIFLLDSTAENDPVRNCKR